MVPAFFCNVLLWGITIWLNGISLGTIVSCLILSVLLFISIWDAKYCQIPWQGNLILLFLASGRVYVLHTLDASHVAGMFVLPACLLAAYVLTGRRGIGGGDIKLAAASGLLLGVTGSLFAFLFGGIAALFFWGGARAVHREHRVFPFGPFFSAGIVFMLWFGETILDGYQTFF